jgi:hypothetical protein
MVSRLNSLVWQINAVSKTILENTYNGKGYDPRLYKKQRELEAEYFTLLRRIGKKIGE